MNRAYYSYRFGLGCEMAETVIIITAMHMTTVIYKLLWSSEFYLPHVSIILHVSSKDNYKTSDISKSPVNKALNSSASSLVESFSAFLAANPSPDLRPLIPDPDCFNFL